MVQNFYKNWLLILKIKSGIWTTSHRQWKVQGWNLMGYFCPKNTFVQLEHYISKIYLTLLSTTCVKIHQITYVIFETIYKSFFTTQFLCIFFAQTLHTFYKSSPSKSKFSDFLLLGLKFTKFLIPFFKQKISLSFSWIFFQCHERWFFCTFLAKALYAITKSSTLKCKLSDLPLVTLKFTKLLMSFLEPRASFSSNFGHSSMSWNITLLYFFI